MNECCNGVKTAAVATVFSIVIRWKRVARLLRVPAFSCIIPSCSVESAGYCTGTCFTPDRSLGYKYHSHYSTTNAMFKLPQCFKDVFYVLYIQSPIHKNKPKTAPANARDTNTNPACKSPKSPKN